MRRAWSSPPMGKSCSWRAAASWGDHQRRRTQKSTSRCHRRAGGDDRSARGVAADLQRRVAHRARLFLRSRTCTAWTGRRCASATAKLVDDARHAQRRELHPRRIARRTERLAHLPQRRRSAESAPMRTRRLSRLRFRARAGRVSHQAHPRGRAVGIHACARRLRAAGR